MDSHPLPNLACTSCGYVFDAATGLNGARVPSAGSVSLCIMCAGIDVFEVSPLGVLSIRAATPEERTKIMQDPFIVRARAEIIGATRE